MRVLTGTFRVIKASPKVRSYEAKYSSGWSPVTLALKRKNVGILRTILSVRGIDLSLKTHYGSTAASIAISQGEIVDDYKYVL